MDFHLKPCNTICPDCKGKAKVNESSLEVTTLDQIMTKLDSIYDSIEAKSVPQTVFVKARPGLGYNESDENTTGDANARLIQTLTEKVHTLDQSLHACKENNSYLKEKVKVHEFQIIRT